jgi:hypothetical protein
MLVRRNPGPMTDGQEPVSKRSQVHLGLCTHSLHLVLARKGDGGPDSRMRGTIVLALREIARP